MFFLYLPFLIILIAIGFLTLGIVEFKCYFEEEKLIRDLATEAAKKREREAKEKLLRAKSILQRVAQEFLIIPSMIDRVDGLSPAEFQSRHQDLWDKTAEAQMLLAFYAPTLTESMEQLDNLR